MNDYANSYSYLFTIHLPQEKMTMRLLNRQGLCIYY